MWILRSEYHRNWPKQNRCACADVKEMRRRSSQMRDQVCQTKLQAMLCDLFWILKFSVVLFCFELHYNTLFCICTCFTLHFNCNVSTHSICLLHFWHRVVVHQYWHLSALSLEWSIVPHPPTHPILSITIVYCPYSIARCIAWPSAHWIAQCIVHVVLPSTLLVVA